jgi:hypothetical protein
VKNCEEYSTLGVTIFTLMHILTLYFAECPNYRSAVANLKQALALRGLDESSTIELTQVADDAQATKLRFVGSPTFQVNGQDLFGMPPGATFGLRCRIYLLNGRALGVPTVDDFSRALEKFR